MAGLYVSSPRSNSGGRYHKVITRFVYGRLQKSNLHCTRGITSKDVTSGGIHLRRLAPGQHSSEETSQRCRHCIRFDRPGNWTPEPPPHQKVVSLTTALHHRKFFTFHESEKKSENSHKNWARFLYYSSSTTVPWNSTKIRNFARNRTTSPTHGSSLL